MRIQDTTNARLAAEAERLWERVGVIGILREEKLELAWRVRGVIGPKKQVVEVEVLDEEQTARRKFLALMHSTHTLMILQS